MLFAAGNTSFTSIINSSKFEFNIFDNEIIFNVIGYGHGVGLSQSGSDVLAKQGKNYEEIIKYVSENFGLKVSNLNIAQVKRKYGIIERSNYNLPKSENSKQPQCTEEKEKAIVEAFKYFKML